MRILRQLLLCLAAISAIYTSRLEAQEIDSVEWLDNYQEALRVAKATGKPIFLEYRCEP